MNELMYIFLLMVLAGYSMLLFGTLAFLLLLYKIVDSIVKDIGAQDEKNSKSNKN